jgi:hypothetical protein
MRFTLTNVTLLTLTIKILSDYAYCIKDLDWLYAFQGFSIFNLTAISMCLRESLSMFFIVF